ncbi:MAG: hypothetical protein LAT57_07785, partial [Balneolales bacterium]|nr:hypothetical protein [Balneolales bacterium]
EAQNEQLIQIDSVLTDAERILDATRTQSDASTQTANGQSDNDIMLARWEIRELQAAGLHDPIQELKDDLMSKPEIIIIDGVLGGSMRIFSPDDITILPGQWAFASFEDGHITGAMLLSFTVENGNITWSVLESKQF